MLFHVFLNVLFALPSLQFLPYVTPLETMIFQRIAETGYWDVQEKSASTSCMLHTFPNCMMPEHAVVDRIRQRQEREGVEEILYHSGTLDPVVPDRPLLPSPA